MDPITAVGIALGVVGVSAQCFTGGLHAVELILSAINLEPQYEYLRVMLQLQQHRFYNWASVSGILAYIRAEGDIDAALEAKLMSLNHNAVFQALIHIQTLAESFVKLEGRYSSITASTRIEQSTNRSGSTQSKVTDQDSVQETLPDIVNFLKKTKHRVSHSPLLKRVRWTSFDKEKFEELVQRFRSLNDALLDLVDYNLRAEIRENTLETRLSVLQLNSKIDDLYNLLKATSLHADGRQPISQNSVSGGFYRGQDVTSSFKQLLLAESKGEIQLADLTRFKIVNVKVEKNESVSLDLENELSILGNTIQLEQVELSRNQVFLDPTPEASGEANISEGSYLPPSSNVKEDIWAEWKYYSPSVKRRGPDPRLTDRVQKLAKLLKASNESTHFRTPTFLGFFDDALDLPASSKSELALDKPDLERLYRFGFIFKKPLRSDPHTPKKVFSLRDVIKTQHFPSLTVRMTVAQKIAQSLLFLHSVDWLHKGLHSSSILFFGDDISNCVLSEPFMSGFGYSRPASKGEMTERPVGPLEHNFYRHPDAHGPLEEDEGQSFRKTFDIYSLGVIFVEIACWLSIDDLLGIEKPHLSAARKIREKLLCDRKYMDRVEASAGALFRNATWNCLTGGAAVGLSKDDDETDVSTSIQILRNLNERVVRVLESIQI